MIFTIPVYFFAPFFLCWGSFLNVAAYRLIRNESIISPRSYCPHCDTLIAWYDNIPVLSWFMLFGKCRTCNQSISFLYPFIEILTASTLTYLYMFTAPSYFLAYFIFFSALIVTIRSDIETMLISRLATVALVPLGFIFSSIAKLPITLFESILGALFGYLFLFITNAVFKYMRGIDGIGEGDFDLLMFIGSFTGIMGCWASITIGSLLGSLYGILLILFTRINNRPFSLQTTKIPFGPFLAIGAILFVFARQSIFNFFLT